MKTNLKRLSGAVLTVAMVGAMSLTAFAADMKIEKLTKAVTITTETTPSASASAPTTIKTELESIDDFIITPQKDGSILVTNKKTGETMQVVMAQKSIPAQQIEKK